MERLLGLFSKARGPPSGGASLACVRAAYELREEELGKLHRAAASGDLARLRRPRWLPILGIDGRDKAKRTPLHLACANGHSEVVSYLVEKKCKLDPRDGFKRSPLMKAVQCQQERCVAILLARGANPNLADANGNTALHLAAIAPSTSLAGQLLEHNAHVDAQNKMGYTPLALAVTEHHEEMVEFLLRKGADVHARDQSERTPLMLAASAGHTSMIEVLLRYGADPSEKDVLGWTAEKYAQISGHARVSQHLAESAAEEKAGEASSGGARDEAVLSTPAGAGAAAVSALGACAVASGVWQEEESDDSCPASEKAKRSLAAKVPRVCFVGGGWGLLKQVSFPPSQLRCVAMGLCSDEDSESDAGTQPVLQEVEACLEASPERDGVVASGGPEVAHTAAAPADVRGVTSAAGVEQEEESDSPWDSEVLSVSAKEGGKREGHEAAATKTDFEGDRQVTVLKTYEGVSVPRVCFVGGGWGLLKQVSFPPSQLRCVALGLCSDEDSESDAGTQPVLQEVEACLEASPERDGVVASGGPEVAHTAAAPADVRGVTSAAGVEQEEESDSPWDSEVLSVSAKEGGKREGHEAAATKTDFEGDGQVTVLKTYEGVSAEEERDETQRALPQEKSARALREEILNSPAWRRKGPEEERRTLVKVSEVSGSNAREKELLYKHRLVRDEIAVLRLEADQERRRSQEEEAKHLGSNGTLKEKNEDLRKELRLNEEALTRTVRRYNGQLNSVKTESAVLTGKLEQAKESKDQLEAEVESLRSRLSSALEELERHEASKSNVEQTFQRERDEWLRLQDKLRRDLCDARDASESLSQQLSKAESKASSLESELHQLKGRLRERTLLSEVVPKDSSPAQSRAKECDRARQLEKDQGMAGQVQQEVTDALEKRSTSEALLAVATRYLRDLEEDKLRLQKELVRVKGKLQELEEQRVQSERCAQDLKRALEDEQREAMASCRQLQDLPEASSGSSGAISRKDVEERVARLEQAKASLEGRAQEQTARLEALQEELHSSASVHNGLEDLMPGLGTRRVPLGEDQNQQCESNGKSVKKLAEWEQPAEARLEEEMQRNIELQKECNRSKRLLETAMKKLRAYERRESESQLDFQSKTEGACSGKGDEVGRLRAKVHELSNWLARERRRSRQLEKANEGLREELAWMHGSRESLRKSKRLLEEEVVALRRHLEAKKMDPRHSEDYRREIEERAEQELRQKLEEVNLFLRTQAATQERVDQIRAATEASTVGRLQRRVSDLEWELALTKRLHRARARERFVEAVAAPAHERCRSHSLLMNPVGNASSVEERVEAHMAESLLGVSACIVMNPHKPYVTV
ncbi:ankyrin repeat domain-containing protein 7 [Rhea pennata]|uniref:ankyrin repeat domain-containing protein 7 n=1 Tax=Rhea pennata TaxID=8795 RepID=UPI002E26DF39